MRFNTLKEDENKSRYTVYSNEMQLNIEKIKRRNKNE